ncbi:MAG TPA: tetratricopeptide repeat protein, partial [Candidatus Udaeobacter sp.]|nr:tetratricopeptide repeat protein [Candidatus Udaeobacter sp.]
VRRRAMASAGAGPAGLMALAFAALLAVNPTFDRYGYSATNDMLALGLTGASLLFLLAPLEDGPRRGLVLSGVLAALAAFTRYSAVALLPAGVLALLFWPRSRVTRGGAITRFVAGFLIVALPWTAFAAARGHLPGAPLLQFFSFYTSPNSNRSVQDLAPTTPDSLRAYRSLGSMLGHDPAGLVRTMLGHIPQHLELEASETLGWPAATLGAIGLLFAILSRTALGLGPLLLIGAIQFLTLVPVFHSDRYALPLVPFELSLAAFALAMPRVRARSRAAALLAGAACVLAAAISLIRSVEAQREVRRLLPTETLEAGRALHRLATPASHVIARKGQIGYYAGLPVAPFPRFARLAELADYARSAHADFLFYSWYEAQLRPEFAWLLDSTAATPGLEVVHATANKKSVLYRMGDGFGRDPDWLGDPYQLRLHQSRALVGVLPDSIAAPYRITLAVDALGKDEPAEAIEEIDQALRWRPAEPLAWQVRGEALMKQGQGREALESFTRSLALSPDDPEVRGDLGLAKLSLGDSAGAAGAWRGAIGGVTDVQILSEMMRLFDKLGDDARADSARAGWHRHFKD